MRKTYQVVNDLYVVPACAPDTVEKENPNAPWSLIAHPAELKKGDRFRAHGDAALNRFDHLAAIGYLVLENEEEDQKAAVRLAPVKKETEPEKE